MRKDAKASGITQTQLKTIASDKQAEVKFENVKVPKANVIAGGWATFKKVLRKATVIECAYLTGLAQMDFEISVQYAKDRIQFGRPIGSFQAIQHKAADMVTDVDGSRFIMYRAAWSVEQDEADAVNRPARAAERAAAAGTDVEPESLFSLASAGGVTTLGSTFLPDEPDASRVAQLLLRRGRAYLPALADAPVLEVRRCARPQSMDGRPFVGPLPWADGLSVCAGHGPWGISTGPGSAALAVEALPEGRSTSRVR